MKGRLRKKDCGKEIVEKRLWKQDCGGKIVKERWQRKECEEEIVKKKDVKGRLKDKLWLKDCKRKDAKMWRVVFYHFSPFYFVKKQVPKGTTNEWKKYCEKKWWKKDFVERLWERNCERKIVEDRLWKKDCGGNIAEERLQKKIAEERLQRKDCDRLKQKDCIGHFLPFS